MFDSLYISLTLLHSFYFVSFSSSFTFFPSLPSIHRPHYVAPRLYFVSLLFCCLSLVFFDIKGFLSLSLSLCAFFLSTCFRIKAKEFKGMERRSLSSRGPAEGLHPSFSYLPIPVRHTSTITLPSRCFKGGGWRLLHSLFLYSSSHPLSFTPPLLSGRRVFVVLLLLFVISRICSFFFSDFL